MLLQEQKTVVSSLLLLLIRYFSNQAAAIQYNLGDEMNTTFFFYAPLHILLCSPNQSIKHPMSVFSFGCN